jgi:glutathione synthase/RimK-type ligase-like ATP-grasp enzyme
MLEQGDALVQAFAPEIERSGEWSFVFFGGAFSHAVLKRPAPGDFRVQTELGGSAVPLDPPPALLDQAATVMGKVQGRWLYARVDGIERDGRLVVLELEMIEPFLFLGQDPQAPARFADAILAPGLR